MAERRESHRLRPLLVAIAVIVLACAPGEEAGREEMETAVEPTPAEENRGETAVDEEETMADAELELTSPAFADGDAIPRKHTCQGDDTSPPLAIAGVPDRAASLALVVDDPDAPAGTWDHWIVYDIDPGIATIDEGQAPAGATQGRNGWGRNDYGGPCPPSGEHRYFFKLYALDTELGLPPGTSKGDLERAMEGHVVAEARLMGRYRKS